MGVQRQRQSTSPELVQAPVALRTNAGADGTEDCFSDGLSDIKTNGEATAPEL